MRWRDSYHRRKRDRWGVVTHPDRSGWDTDVAGIDLLGRMVDEQRRRNTTPKPKLP
jgi:hypothetical protein